MIILIFIALFQALILPGLLCSYYIKRLEFQDRLIFSSTLSLLSNYFIVWIMYSLKIYSQISLLILFAVEIFILFKFKNLVIKDIYNFYSFISLSFKNIIKCKSLDFFTLFFIIFCIYYLYLLKTNGFLTVFTHWDAVVSWNRWAIELHQGSFQGSRGYPLSIPILFSLIYTFTDEVNIQTFVKYICIYWPFLGGLVIFRCGSLLPKFKNICAFATILYLYFLSKGSWTSDFIFSGLVDPIMAAYGAIFIFCCIFLFSSPSNQNEQYRYISITTLSIATGALIKLTGLFLFVYFLFIVSAFIINNNYLRLHKKYFFFLFAISIFISFHWYVLTTFYWRDWQLLSEYSSLQDSRIWMRPFNLFILFINTFGLFLTVLILLGIFYSRKVFIFSLFTLVPLFLFCSITVGYDLRATFILFAPLSILAVLGSVRCSRLITSMLTKKVNVFSAHILLNKYYLLILSFIILITTSFVLIKKFSRDEILRSNTEKRIAANNFGNNGNQKLIEIFEKEPSARIISCWQTPWGLPGAPGKFIPTGNCTVTLLEGWLSDSSIKYWLYRDEGNSSQPLSPNFVTKFLSSQSIPIHSESLGSGFILYSKIDINKNTD